MFLCTIEKIVFVFEIQGNKKIKKKLLKTGRRFDILILVLGILVYFELIYKSRTRMFTQIPIASLFDVMKSREIRPLFEVFV